MPRASTHKLIDNQSLPAFKSETFQKDFQNEEPDFLSKLEDKTGIPASKQQDADDIELEKRHNRKYESNVAFKEAVIDFADNAEYQSAVDLNH